MAPQNPAQAGVLTPDANQSSSEANGNAPAAESHDLKHRPPPLHLETVKSTAESAGEESLSADYAQVVQDHANKYRHSLSLASQQLVAKNLEDLSQLRSPVLKVILSKLEEKYNIKPTGCTAKSPIRKTDRPANPYAEFNVAPKWREIQGCNLWNGLMDPLDPILKTEIMRYGEFAQATYDSFDDDPNSKYCGSTKYTKEEFFDKLELDHSGYEVTHFLYATSQLDLPNFFVKSFLSDAWSKDSNWIGYVAVTTSPEEIARLGRRDIMIAWRGTVTSFEWIKDVQDYTMPASFDPRHGNDNVRVESGFLSLYSSFNDKSRYNEKSVRHQVLSAVKELIEKFKHEGNLSITITGHSLGSALATLCGYDLAESQINIVSQETKLPCAWHEQSPSLKSPRPSPRSSKLTASELVSKEAEPEPHKKNPSTKQAEKIARLTKAGNDFQAPDIPITVISFAGPRVGNRAFKERVDELGVAVLRVANQHDLVTKIPGVVFQRMLEFLQPIVSFIPSYKHAGVKFKINHLNSPFLKTEGTNMPTDIGNAHNLEGYLHVVDGFHGTTLPFNPTMRDYALVNKRSDFLKVEYFIPANWWQEAFKGLVRDVSGHWLVPKRDLEIFPTTPLVVVPGQSAQKLETKGTAEFWDSVSVAAKRSGTLAETPRPKQKTSDEDASKSSSSGGPPSNGETPPPSKATS